MSKERKLLVCFDFEEKKVTKIHSFISVVHDLQLTQFDSHSADVGLKISRMTIKLSQKEVLKEKIVDLKLAIAMSVIIKW